MGVSLFAFCNVEKAMLQYRKKSDGTVVTYLQLDDIEGPDGQFYFQAYYVCGTGKKYQVSEVENDPERFEPVKTNIWHSETLTV